MITRLSAKNVPVKRTTLSSWGRSSVSSPFYNEEETQAQSTKNSEQPSSPGWLIRARGHL